MQPEAKTFHDRPVGEIAATLPGASAVFRLFGIDFCCHGERSLTEAANGRALDPADLEAALAALDPDAVPAAPQETGALIDHIMTRYHEVHRRQLPELATLSRKVETVHAAHPAVPAGLADLLERMIGELEVHMKKEELMLFPVMRRQAGGALNTPIGQMRHDHDDHAQALARIEALTGGYAAPEGACRSWQALIAGAEALRNDLMEHIHLENNVLFPRFEAAGRA